MALDLLTFGEALVEVMRTGIDQPLDQPALFTGPYPSGAPFIFAVQAARLGAKVGAIGAVGDDAFGKCQIDQLKVDGVDTRGMKVLTTHTTGVAFVAYNKDGTRDFVFHAKQAAAGQITPDMLDESLFDGLKCLHIMGSTLSMHTDALNTGLRALELAQKAGTKISFDPNLRPQMMPPEQARDAFVPFIAAADVLMPTAEEISLLTGINDLPTAVNSLLESKPDRIIVITQSKNGCTVYTGGASAQHIPGFNVQEIDPTGAGDCFDAGFLACWLQGDTLSDAAQFANACGALAVTAQGPMAGAQKLDVVETFLSNNLPTEESLL